MRSRVSRPLHGSRSDSCHWPHPSPTYSLVPSCSLPQVTL